MTMMLNETPSAQGISETFSPQVLVTQRVFDFDKMPKVEIGEYIEASTTDEKTNDMKSRTHELIALGPAGNFQGSLKCFDVETGKVVWCRTYKTLPISDRIIKVMHKWVQGQKA